VIMNDLMYLLAGGVIFGVILILLKRKRLRQIPEISDQEFLRVYRTKFGTPEEIVLRERRYLGKVLGIPDQKLSPEQTLKGLSKHGGLIEFQVGMGDLDSDLIDLLDRAGVESKDFTPPPTVGELIA